MWSSKLQYNAMVYASTMTSILVTHWFVNLGRLQSQFPTTLNLEVISWHAEFWLSIAFVGRSLLASPVCDLGMFCHCPITTKLHESYRSPHGILKHRSISLELPALSMSIHIYRYTYIRNSAGAMERGAYVWPSQVDRIRQCQFRDGIISTFPKARGQTFAFAIVCCIILCNPGCDQNLVSIGIEVE